MTFFGQTIITDHYWSVLMPSRNLIFLVKIYNRPRPVGYNVLRKFDHILVKHLNRSHSVSYNVTLGNGVHVAPDGSVGPRAATFFNLQNRLNCRSVFVLKPDQFFITDQVTTDHPFRSVLVVKPTVCLLNRPFLAVGFVLFSCSDDSYSSRLGKL